MRIILKLLARLASDIKILVNEKTTVKECHSILRDEASVYFNVTAVYV